MATTWDEASRCPKCRNAGDAGAAMPSARPGTNVVNVFCRNPLCTWCDTSWVVQINPDGSIPDAAPAGVARGDKQYEVPRGHLLQAGVTDEIIEKVNREASGMSTPGAKELGGR